LARRSRVAHPGAAAADGGATAWADFDGEAGADDAGVAAAEEAAAEDEGTDAGADTVVDAEDTGGGTEDELPAAHPVTTAPAAATPASLSNNETEPVITHHPF
jgi:hypothetical protein